MKAYYYYPNIATFFLILLQTYCFTTFTPKAQTTVGPSYVQQFMNKSKGVWLSSIHLCLLFSFKSSSTTYLHLFLSLSIFLQIFKFFFPSFFHTFLDLYSYQMHQSLQPPYFRKLLNGFSIPASPLGTYFLPKILPNTFLFCVSHFSWFSW